MCILHVALLVQASLIQGPLAQVPQVQTYWQLRLHPDCGVLQSLTASAYVFCAALQSALPAATHTTSIAFPLVQDTRPITADWPALADTNGTWVYFDAQIQ